MDPIVVVLVLLGAAVAILISNIIIVPQATAHIAKINEVDKKVDMMAAVRPYQDALINCKIDNVALVSDFNLARRTCRMITGELVLPSTPTVTGYASYNPCSFQAATGTTGA